MENLTGKTAVVTGAASGIGLELAHTFGKAGMNLVLADIEVPALDAAEAALTDLGYPVAAMQVDVREISQLQALEALARDRFGNVHVLCNNAGVGGGGAVADLDNLELWRWVIDIDLWGVIYGCKAFLPAMLEHGEPCHVVNTASMAGLTAVPGMGSYCVSKAGVVALSETLAMEMQSADTNIGVSVLCPGFVQTAIGDSSRNLPDDLRDKAPATDGPLQGVINALVGGGIGTDVVSAAVLDAILNNRFWILTHEETRAAVTRRAEGIVNGVNPVVNRPV